MDVLRSQLFRSVVDDLIADSEQRGRRMRFTFESVEQKGSFFDEPLLRDEDFSTKLMLVEVVYWKCVASVCVIEIARALVFDNLPPIFRSIEQNTINDITSYFSNADADPNVRIAEGGITLLTFACSTDFGSRLNRSRLDAFCRRRLSSILYLIRKGADVNGGGAVTDGRITLFSQMTPLIMAARERNVPLIRLLLKHGADPNIPLLPLRLTPLHFVAFGGSYSACKTLLQSGSDINAQDSDGFTPLIFACSVMNFPFVAELLKLSRDVRADVNLCTYSRKITALHAAVFSGNPELVVLILSRGARVNAKTVEGHTPMDFAVMFKRQEIRRILADHGGSPSTFQVESQGKPNQAFLLSSYASGNPLLNSVWGGYTTDVKYLLEHGFDVNAPNVYGQTPLFFAIWSNSMDLVKLLLEFNADVNAEASDGWTPIHLAVDNGFDIFVDLLLVKGAKIDNLARPLLYVAAQLTPPCGAGLNMKAFKEIRAVIALKIIMKGALIDEKFEGLTPWEHAVKWGNEPVAAVISRQCQIFRCIQNNNLTELKKHLKEGAVPQCRSVKFGTPLQYAVVKNRLDIVSTLLENGADVNHATPTGVTPLHYAAKFNCRDIAEKLLSHGAVVNSRTVKTGRTPSEICLESHPPDCETATFLKFVESLFVLRNGGGGTGSIQIKARNVEGQSVEYVWREAKAQN